MVNLELFLSTASKWSSVVWLLGLFLDRVVVSCVGTCFSEEMSPVPFLWELSCPVHGLLGSALPYHTKWRVGNGGRGEKGEVGPS